MITKDAAALWTDGRYFLQAEGQLHCSWFLMRDGKLEVNEIFALSPFAACTLDALYLIISHSHNSSLNRTIGDY